MWRRNSGLPADLSILDAPIVLDVQKNDWELIASTDFGHLRNKPAARRPDYLIDGLNEGPGA